MRKTKKNKMTGYYITTGILIILIALSLWVTFLFRVKEIEIIGESRYSREEILFFLDIYPKDNMNTLNYKKISQKALKALPELETISFKKGSFGTLKVTIEESTAKFAVFFNENYLLVTENWKMYRTETAKPVGLPIVTGYEPRSMTAGSTLDTASSLRAQTLKTVIAALDGKDGFNKINLRDEYNVELEYDGRITCNIGAAEDLDYKIAYILTVIGKIPDTDEGILTLRGTNSASYITKNDWESYLELLK